MRGMPFLLLIACTSKDTDTGVAPTTDTDTTETGSTTDTADTGTTTVFPPVFPDFSRRRIAANKTYTCWLDFNYSTVSCVGDGPIMDYIPNGQFVQITAGEDHACVLDLNGAATCWGDNTYGQSTVPPQTYFLEITAAEQHTCGLLTTGGLACWGNTSEYYGFIYPPEGIFKQVSSGLKASCAIRDDDVVLCWGYNFFPAPPVGVAFTRVSVGLSLHACGITDDNQVTCWGDNSFGQTTSPIEGSYTDVVAGHIHSCALTSDGGATCWGEDTLDRLDVPDGAGFLQLALGDKHSCAMSNSAIECWGDNQYGQIP